MENPTSIIVALRPDHGFDRQAFSGIAAYAREHGRILLHLKGRDQSLRDAFSQHDAAGAVLSSSSPPEVRAAEKIGRPCVNVANYLEGHDSIPVIGNDDKAIGEMVARHFLERGYEHFAFFTDVTLGYFTSRSEGFSRAISEAGYHCAVGPPLEGVGGRRKHWDVHIAEWIASLPRPLGIFAGFDEYAREALTACSLAGLRVPEEVSVVGVDNDEMICMTTTPHLSSVSPAATRIGHQAMHVLFSMLDGLPAPRQPILMPPVQIVLRGSSSEMAVDDPYVAAAVAFIRRRVALPIGVDDVVEHLSMSRRAVERRFFATLRRTPSEEIRRTRIEVAKQLLIESDLTLAEVARRSGLMRQQRLSMLLKRETGHTPRSFRQEHRLCVQKGMTQRDKILPRSVLKNETY